MKANEELIAAYGLAHIVGDEEAMAAIYEAADLAARAELDEVRRGIEHSQQFDKTPKARA